MHSITGIIIIIGKKEKNRINQKLLSNRVTKEIIPTINNGIDHIINRLAPYSLILYHSSSDSNDLDIRNPYQ